MRISSLFKLPWLMIDSEDLIPGVQDPLRSKLSLIHEYYTYEDGTKWDDTFKAFAFYRFSWRVRIDQSLTAPVL